MCSDRQARRRREAGFTLLEVLVAFTIFAISATAIFQIFAGGLSNGATANRALIALGHAESLLARAGIEEPLAVGQRTGQFDDGMTWREEVALHRSTSVVGSPPAGMTPYEVTVAVSWQDGSRTRDVTLHSLRLGVAP